MLSQIGLIVGLVVSPTVRQFADEISQGVQLMLLSNSREHESQSDQLGVEYSTKIGYDANYMANFFQTIGRISESSGAGRSEEHTSELQSRGHLVCRLL